MSKVFTFLSLLCMLQLLTRAQTSLRRITQMASTKYNDPDGFDPVADTVGAGIYGGNVKRDANGAVIIGKQYKSHNPYPGPVYDGTGYTLMSQMVHTGDPKKVAEFLEKHPELVNDISTGGATPLHTAGMSRKPYSGDTPMDTARQSGAYQVVKVLQKYQESA